MTGFHLGVLDILRHKNGTNPLIKLLVRPELCQSVCIVSLLNLVYLFYNVIFVK